MFYNNAVIPIEEENLYLFRYMDSWKLYDFLESKAIYFSRADELLGYDKDEGFLSDCESQYYLDTLYGNGMYDFLYANHNGMRIQVGDYTMTWNRVIDIANIQKNSRKNFDAFKNWIFINCWNIGKYESDLMWHRYTKSQDSIAITTTLDKLKIANESCPKAVYCKKIDYLTPDVATYKERVEKYFRGLPKLFLIIRLFFDKKIEFRHDDELRLIYVDTETFSGDSTAIYEGIGLTEYKVEKTYHKLDFDPALIIDKIILHPKASKKFKEELLEKLNNLGYQDLIPKISISTL